MPASKQSIINSSVAEWEHWGQSRWNLVTLTSAIGHTDDESDYAQYVIDEYCSVGGGTPSLDEIADDRYFWSAVGMSGIMKNAGFSKKEFPFSQLHSTWIRAFIAARRTGLTEAAYWGFRTGESGGAPEPGDLVAYARGDGMTQAKAAKLFDAVKSYPSHTDLVIAKRASEIDVIGCNVKDSVTKKTLTIDAEGHITDTVHAWFAVLKLRLN
jgi:hypothetical protein